MKHDKIHIGQSKNQANKRFYCHRYDMKKATEIPSDSEKFGTEVSEQFTSSPHDTKDMQVHVLDNNPKWKKPGRLALGGLLLVNLKRQNKMD